MKQRNLFLLVALCGVMYMPLACSNDGDVGDGDGDGDGDAATGGDPGDGDTGDGDATSGGQAGSTGDGDGDLGTGGGNEVTCDGEGTSCTDGSSCCSGYCDPSNDTCSCASAGEQCEGGGDCCSGQCNTLTNTCALILGTCLQADTPCNSGAECCTSSCVDGFCSDVQCVEDSATCAEDGECCSGQCVDDACAPINPGATCKSAGNPCLDGGDCCSGLCNDEGYCAIGASYCVQLNDICSSDAQCCQGVCNKASGANLGYCGTQESPGTRCGNEKIAGEVCGGENDCNSCCSKTCAPYGPSGVFICQPPTGCRTDGELCRTAADCCGGLGDEVFPGSNTAECLKVNASDDIGRCKVGACNPHGAICKDPDGAKACNMTLTAPAGNKCCGSNTLPQAQNPCVSDDLLVPRCSTYQGECRMPGDTCQTSSDCCEGLPCVQDETGTFICYDPPGGSCVDEGGPCTVDADCCVGSSCLKEAGQVTGVCGATDPPPGSGGSGMGGNTGSGGSPTTCASYGQDCSTAACCNDVPCDGVTNTCRYGGG